jgi:hypothetical protein
MATALRLLAGEVRPKGAAALSFACAAPSELASELSAVGFQVRPAARTLIGLIGDRIVKDSSKAHILEALDRWYVTEADEDQ